MNILIVNDGTITARALQDHLPAILSAFQVDIKVLQFESAEYELTKQSQQNIREYYGSPDELKTKVADVDIMVIHAAPVTREVIAAARHLKLIACARGSTPNIDLAAATERGIPVLFARGRATIAVAELVIGLMVMLARNLTSAASKVKQLKQKAWEYPIRTMLQGRELLGATLGIIGFGDIGQQVSVRAQALGMRILVYSPSIQEQSIRSQGGTPVPLEPILKESDFLSLHTRPRPDQLPIIGYPELMLMKPSAYLINTARASLIDEDALYNALIKGTIRGAALDVLSEEPPHDTRLLQLENVIVLPHIGSKTEQVPVRSEELIGEELKRFLQGLAPVNVANPDFK